MHLYAPATYTPARLAIQATYTRLHVLPHAAKYTPQPNCVPSRSIILPNQPTLARLRRCHHVQMEDAAAVASVASATARSPHLRQMPRLPEDAEAHLGTYSQEADRGSALAAAMRTMAAAGVAEAVPGVSVCPCVRVFEPDSHTWVCVVLFMQFGHCHNPTSAASFYATWRGGCGTHCQSMTIIAINQF